jgi:hypothetical protein
MGDEYKYNKETESYKTFFSRKLFLRQFFLAFSVKSYFGGFLAEGEEVSFTSSAVGDAGYRIL